MKKNKFIGLMSLFLVLNSLFSVTYASFGKVGEVKNLVKISENEKSKLAHFRLCKLNESIGELKRFYSTNGLYICYQIDSIIQLVTVNKRSIFGGKMIRKFPYFMNFLKNYGSSARRACANIVYGSEHNLPLNFLAAEYAFKAVADFKKFNQNQKNAGDLSQIYSGNINEKLRSMSIPMSLDEFMGTLSEEKCSDLNKFLNAISDVIISLFDLRQFYRLVSDDIKGIKILDSSILLLVFVQNSLE